MHVPLFYKQKPVFGLDIGSQTIKLAQIKPAKHKNHVAGYAYGSFDPSARRHGEITKPEVVAEAIKQLIRTHAFGKISASQVFMSVPSSQTYVRVMNTPALTSEDLEEAVKLEAEQYVPLPSAQLYLEHIKIGQLSTNKQAEKMSQVLMVAVPKKIIDSHIKVSDLLGYEVAGIEPSMFANLRSVHYNCPQHVPKIVIDFGARSSDLAIYENNLRLASTAQAGGQIITDLIAKGLNVSAEEAHHIKIRFGIAKSKWQVQLASILQPVLSDFANEVQKTMRYYHEHSGGKNISDIFMVGGGANMPGLSEFLSHLTGVRVQICNPWANLAIQPLRPPHPSDTTVYTTAIGLALKEVVKDD